MCLDIIILTGFKILTKTAKLILYLIILNKATIPADVQFFNVSIGILQCVE